MSLDLLCVLITVLPASVSSLGGTKEKPQKGDRLQTRLTPAAAAASPINDNVDAAFPHRSAEASI